MTWNDLLDRARRSGITVREEDYLDDYGPFASREHERLRNRHFRCTFGRARMNDVEVEAYSFPTEDEAIDFLSLIETARGCWTRHRNMLLHAGSGSDALLERIGKTIG